MDLPLPLPPAEARRPSGVLLLAALGTAGLLSVVLGITLPVVALAVGMAVAYARTPIAALVLYFALFALTIGSKPGLQPEEVLFLAYHVGYLGAWFGLRVFAYRERLVQTPLDWAVALFVGAVAFAALPTVVFRGNLGLAANEALNFSLLVLYFPVREACARYERGSVAVLAVLFVLALAGMIYNVALLRAAISDAAMAWEVARARVATSEMLITTGAICALSLIAYVHGTRRQLALLVAFAVLSLGVVLTQSRAYYVDLAVGVGAVLVLMPSGKRGPLVLSLVGGAVVAAGGAWLVLGDFFELVVYGIIDRALSLATATSSDVSFLNRALETRAVWERIVANPILGYGYGVPFGFHDSLFDGYWSKTYAHNGFLTLWYRLGLAGLLALLAAWGLAVLTGIRTARLVGAPLLLRGVGLAAAATLICLLPSHFVSATFSTADTVLCFAALLGMAAGTREQALALTPSSE